MSSELSWTLRESIDGSKKSALANAERQSSLPPTQPSTSAAAGVCIEEDNASVCENVVNIEKNEVELMEVDTEVNMGEEEPRVSQSTDLAKTWELGTNHVL